MAAADWDRRQTYFYTYPPSPVHQHRSNPQEPQNDQKSHQQQQQTQKTEMMQHGVQPEIISIDKQP